MKYKYYKLYRFIFIKPFILYIKHNISHKNIHHRILTQDRFKEFEEVIVISKNNRMHIYDDFKKSHLTNADRLRLKRITKKEYEQKKLLAII